jgi:ATP-dependent DNA helicase RecQ
LCRERPAADRDRLELAQQKLRRMEAVAEGELCREQALLLAVGELAPPCGRCDNCLSVFPRQDWSPQALRVLEALEQAERGRDLRSLSSELGKGADPGEDRWGWLARRLVQEELISESDDGTQRLRLRSSGRCYLRSPWPLHWAA